MAKALFITYDGLTDTLGQSQILPYMCGLSQKGHQITILSCEKNDKFQKNEATIRTICSANSINWVPLKFHSSPPILSKYYDLYSLTKTAKKLYQQEKFDIIHCRSYLSATIGVKLKHKYGAKYLFDMRGFWVDERVDGGLWDTQHFLYKNAYRKWKKKEAMLISEADHIVSLTDAAKHEISTWPAYKNAPITVIPCSADLDLFTMTSESDKKDFKRNLGIGEDYFVLSYLGSLGTWYLLDEMLLFFSRLKQRINKSKFLFITPDNPDLVLSKLEKYGLNSDDVLIKFAARKDVPAYMKSSDISCSFIKPAYSKIASSPTKLGELLAMNIPVLCNDIGDVKSIVLNSNGGVLLPDFTTQSIDKAIEETIHRFVNNNEPFNRSYIVSYYDLKEALLKYESIYQTLI